MPDPEGFQADLPPERPRRPPERRPRRRPAEDEADEEQYDGSDEAVATIIPYKNPKALLAYYFGIFGLIPVVGLVLGPAAIVLGILGLRHVSRKPKAHGTGHAIAGIVLGILDLYNWVFIILGVIVFLFAGARR